MRSGDLILPDLVQWRSENGACLSGSYRKGKIRRGASSCPQLCYSFAVMVIEAKLTTNDFETIASIGVAALSMGISVLALRSAGRSAKASERQARAPRRLRLRRFRPS